MITTTNCIRCGYPAENAAHDDCCPDGEAHAYPTRESKEERKRCADVARNFWPAVDGSLPEHYAKVVRETRECIANEILARGNPPSKPEQENVKVPECSHCDDCKFVAGNNDDLVHGRRTKPCPACNPSGTRPAPKDREICPDCKRPKARDIDDCRRGDCPKWYMIRDPQADQDCVKHRMDTLAVIAEGLQLRDRLTKLRGFINTPAFGVLDAAERSRLTRQLRLMQGYYEVLDERIAAFMEPKKPLDPETWLVQHGYRFGRRDNHTLQTQMPKGLAHRMRKYKGDFIVFDPNDDDDGYCIVGKDLTKLQREAFEDLYEEPLPPVPYCPEVSQGKLPDTHC